MRTQGGRRGAERYWMIVILALVVLVQGTLLSRIRFVGAHPNLLLVVVVCWSLRRSVSAGLVWGFVGGLGLDLVASMPLGTSSLALMPVSFLAGLGRNSIFASNLGLPMLLVALATPIYGWIVLLSQQLRGVPVEWWGTTLRVIAPELLLNAALTVLAYPVLRWVASQTGAASMEW